MRCEAFRQAMMPSSDVIVIQNLDHALIRHADDCRGCALWLEHMQQTSSGSQPMQDLSQRLEAMRIWP